MTEAGALISQWTPDRIRAAIAATDLAIQITVSYGDMDHAQTLVSRKIGLKICAGDIVVKLKKRKYVG